MQYDLASLCEDFQRDGFAVLRGFVDAERLASLRAVVEEALNPPLAPLEYEAEVGYAGAPASRDAPGGLTPRRLLNAYSRDRLLRAWAHDAELLRALRALIGSDALMLSQNHHNCVMTKFPGYSSVTGWHRDIRYWSFDRPELINAWLALGEETADNGALAFLPGSHTEEVARGRLDAALFLRADLAENRAMIDTAATVELAPGDVVLFHCRTFHAAGNNRTLTPKLSLAYSFRAADNLPIPNTRSARYADIPLP